MLVKIKIALTSIFIFILLGASVYAYIIFVQFTPSFSSRILEGEPTLTAQAQEGEVNGASTLFLKQFEYPAATELGFDSISTGEKVSYATQDAQQQVQDYYESVLISNEWEIDNKGEAGIFKKTNYKKGKQNLIVTTSTDETTNSTILILELINN